MSSALLKQLVLGSGNDALILRNRIFMAPLTRSRHGINEIMGNPHQVEYYRQRASVGLIITEASSISEQGKGWAEAGTIYRPEDATGWRKVTDAVHEANGKIFIQLWHMGRAGTIALHGIQPVAPSAIRITKGKTRKSNNVYIDSEDPRSLETSEIPFIVDDFRKAAVLAKEAGFDGIQIHAANGYLVDQFLQSTSNKRTDKYGGSFENRYKFLDEILDAVLTVWPSNRVAIRLSPNGAYNDMGSEDNHEAYTYYLKQLEKRNLAFIEILDGLAFGYHGKDKQFRLYDARKAGYTGVLVGNCGYTPDKAEAVVESGVADAIAIGRYLISNPDLVERVEKKLPLAPFPPHEVFYDYPEGNPGKGYTDFPTYES